MDFFLLIITDPVKFKQFIDSFGGGKAFRKSFIKQAKYYKKWGYSYGESIWKVVKDIVNSRPNDGTGIRFYQSIKGNKKIFRRVR
ncbi:MAG: hypothetical protein IEMM0008_0757 [bacterium]|nr:MAG: hypothetical protein IEMM0008_0757 [bacterium]